MSENKVQFGLKNVHYAKISYSDAGVISYGTPKAVKGAVTLTLDAQGEVTPFYADNITYFQAVSNNGYSGDLEMARFPDEMLQDIWGMTLGGTSKVLTENANTEPSEFALLYQIDGDVDEQCYVLYRCSGTRPAIGSSTTTNTKEPQTQTSTISALPVAAGNVMARTTADTPSATKAAWFNSVFVESP